jgi:hypothetical protein
MLKTVIRFPLQWRNFHKDLSTIISLAVPTSLETNRLWSEFIRLGQEILSPDITLEFIQAYDRLMELRRKARKQQLADPSDKIANMLFHTFTRYSAYLLSIRCLPDFLPKRPPGETSISPPKRDKPSRRGGLIINWSYRDPITDVIPKLDDLPPAVTKMLENERSEAKNLAATALSESEEIRDTDPVLFSLAAPKSVFPGSAFVIDVWAHLASQREEVMKRSQALSLDEQVSIREKGPTKLSRGTVVTVRMRLPGFEVEDNEDTLLWEGEISSAGFPVRAPESLSPGDKTGSVFFFVGSFQVAKLHFPVRVTQEPKVETSNHVEQSRFRTAFASYASENRDEVLNVIQGLEKGLPGMDIFLDVARLRSGQKWQDELWSVIPNRDIFYLFWSEAASRSPWVEKEWRCALEARGTDFISPIPLVSPEVIPPPKELGDLHFNDWVLAYKRRPTNSA